MSSQKDWDPWIAIVKAKATGYKIWNLINPALEEKPAARLEPTRPILNAMEGDDFVEKNLRYKYAMTEYKQDLQAYKEEQEAMAKMITHIYDTTASGNLTFIEKVEVHPWNVLRALKARLAPKDAARRLDLEKRYRHLIKGPSKSQSAEAWLDDYQKMHDLGKEYKIAEIVDEERAYRDFLEAVHGTIPEFSNAHYMALYKVTNFDEKLLQIIEECRHYLRLTDARKKSSASNSAFAASVSSDNTTSEENNNKPTFRGGKQPPTCICGHKHWYSDCHYLNEEQRPVNWKPNGATQKKVDEALKNDKKRKQVESNIARSKEIKEKKTKIVT